MKRIAAVMLALLLVVTPVTASDADAEEIQPRLLVDFGNGSVQWLPIPQGEHLSIRDAAASSLAAAGVPFEESSHGNGFLSVGGAGSAEVGGQTCEWRFYFWNSYAWDYGETRGAMRYSGEDLALGFYPFPGIVPAATPLDPDVWTGLKGDSRNSSVSGSFGPETVATPLEWHIPHSTGGVYSSLLYANGLMYHSTGGDTNGTGVDRNPCIYCIDTVNHEVAWELHYVNKTGYEVSSPVIVGDLLIVTSSNGHIYALDRYDGSAEAELVPKGEMPHFASRLDTTEYEFASCYDADHNWIMEGNYFATGPTTSVYDSGALYFNTFDGLIRSYSISPEDGFRELWTHRPADTDRGSFYCYPPVISDVDGRRVVLSGNFAGKLFCLDAGTGEPLWIQRVIDNRSAASSNPGCVSGIYPCGGNRAVVTCDDGEMSPFAGHTMAVDLRDGSTIWSIDAISSPGPVADGTFYTYCSPAVVGAQIPDKHGDLRPLNAGYCAIDTENGRLIWCNESGTYTKSGMVLCDSRLYCLDYAPGTFWPQGGAARCLDPDTGTQIWRVKLEPFSGTGYTMSTPTVVGGKVYVANDTGIVYCISDTPGVDVHVTDDIEYQPGGFLHWTWLVLFTITAVLTGLGIVLYRRG